MKQEVIAQIQAVRNELDALTFMLYDMAEREEEPVNDAMAMAMTPDDNDDGEYLSVRQVARRYGVTPATIYRWAREGRFPAGKYWGPRTRRWRASELE